VGFAKLATITELNGAQYCNVMMRLHEVSLHSLLIHYMSINYDQFVKEKRIYHVNSFNIAYLLSSDKLAVATEEDAVEILWRNIINKNERDFNRIARYFRL
jgi:hypothetical protein